MRFRLFIIAMIFVLGSVASQPVSARQEAVPYRQEAQDNDNLPKATPLRTPIQEPPLPVLCDHDTVDAVLKASPPPPLLTLEELKKLEAEDAASCIVPVVTTGTAYLPKGIRIALLLPLSGANAAEGEALLHAALLAFAETKSGGTLLPFDTAGTPAGTLSALNDAIAAGANTVLVSAGDDAVNFIANRVENSGITAIAFADNPMLASGHMLVFGISREEQAKRILDYAAKHGVHTFSALLPDNPANTRILELMKGKTQKTVTTYADDVKLQEAVTALLALPEGLTPAEDFGEGLLLTGEGEQLQIVLKKIAADPKAEKRFQLLGLSNWGNPEFLKEKALQDAWFAVSPPELRYAFGLRFEQMFGHAASPTASLAYDAVALLASLGADNNSVTREELINPLGFAGINGIFRFTEAGTTERLLGIAQITKDGFVIIDPVPAGFPPSKQ